MKKLILGTISFFLLLSKPQVNEKDILNKPNVESSLLLNSKLENSLIENFLDTGEELIVYQNSVIPLPKNFKKTLLWKLITCSFFW